MKENLHTTKGGIYMKIALEELKNIVTTVQSDEAYHQLFVEKAMNRLDLNILSFEMGDFDESKVVAISEKTGNVLEFEVHYDFSKPYATDRFTFHLKTVKNGEEILQAEQWIGFDYLEKHIKPYIEKHVIDIQKEIEERQNIKFMYINMFRKDLEHLEEYTFAGLIERNFDSNVIEVPNVITIHEGIGNSFEFLLGEEGLRASLIYKTDGSDEEKVRENWKRYLEFINSLQKKHINMPNGENFYDVYQYIAEKATQYRFDVGMSMHRQQNEKDYYIIRDVLFFQYVKYENKKSQEHSVQLQVQTCKTGLLVQTDIMGTTYEEVYTVQEFFDYVEGIQKILS